MEYARNMAKEGPLGVLRPDTDVYMCSINYLACNCSLWNDGHPAIYYPTIELLGLASNPECFNISDG